MNEILWLSRDDVAKTGVCNMDTAVKIVKEAFRLFDEQKAIIAQESALRLHSDGNEQACYSLPAYVGGGSNVCGLKWTAHGNASDTEPRESRIQASIIINEADCKIPLSIMNGTDIGAVRTGAVTAIALQSLAPGAVKKVALCGAGGQAEYQLQAILYSLPNIEEAAIWSRGYKKAENLAARYQEKTPVPIYPAETVEDAVDSADVVIAATSADTPYLTAAMLESASLYCHIGFKEITWEAINQFNNIVVDTWEEAKNVSGQSLFQFYREGLFDEKRVTGTLGAMVSGRIGIPKCTPDSKLMFDAFGLPIFDVALAKEAYRRALRLGLGVRMNW